MCPLVKEFQKYPKDFETIVCVTGQHREMLDQVLRIFEVKPDYDLDIMKQGQDLYDVTARVLTGMRDVLKEVKPDVVLVHGDTTVRTRRHGPVQGLFADAPGPERLCQRDGRRPEDPAEGRVPRLAPLR